MLDTENQNQAQAERQLVIDFEAKPPVVEDWRAQVPSVSQLTRRIRGHLENSFFDVWVKGEISNFRKPVSGHAYFCLKDSAAQMKAVMFRPVLGKLKFELKDGMEILLHGKVTVYEARGEYQMVCDAVEPVGAGALQLAFEQLKARLQAEGLFDPKHKKKLPFLPQRIGVVTSATGAAVRDILKVLSRRFPNRHIVILPASVQGEKAPAEICAAIASAERWNRERIDSPIDVLIVGRGGGSLEDMWCFNDETVARAIFACKIPLISAVGHEIDFTIADFVADVRAPTPSAAAEIVVPRLEDLVFQVKTHRQRLLSVVKKRLEQTRLHLGHLGQRLVDPRQRVRDILEKYVLMRQKMAMVMRNRLKLCRQRWESSTHMLHTLSPLQVIGRGYSLTHLADGRIVRSVSELSPGERVQTRLSDGSFTAEVIEVSSENA